jgi:hypothetical protein
MNRSLVGGSAQASSGSARSWASVVGVFHFVSHPVDDDAPALAFPFVVAVGVEGIHGAGHRAPES